VTVMEISLDGRVVTFATLRYVVYVVSNVITQPIRTNHHVILDVA